MIDVANHCDQVLAILFSTPLGNKLIKELGRRDLVPNWNNPEWTWKTDREPQIAGDSSMKGFPATRKLKGKNPDKVRGRSVGKK